VLDALVDALTADRLGAWDDLVLARMNGQSPVGVLLADALRTRGFTASLEASGASFHVPLPASWDAYLAALTPSRRAWVRRSIRAFEKWAGDDVRLEVATTREELERMKAELVALHQRRWADAGRAGAFASRRFTAFHDALMPALFDRGALELLALRARGRTVAVLYNLVWRGKVQFYQCGRATDLGPNVRPGIVIHARAIARAIERGLSEYDFLPSLVRYKAELSLASRPILSLRAARPSSLEVARRAAWLAMEHARAIKRSRRARAPQDTEESDG
jgi:CelD/BcsL family acetyltransferase involved in cellulose biosynthesis